MAEEQTKITQIEPSEMADLFSIGESAKTKEEFTKNDARNPFKRPSDLDLDIKDEVVEPSEEELVEPALAKKESVEIDLNLGEADETEDKQEKAVTLKSIKDLEKKGALLLFEGDKKLEDYSDKDLTELLEANFDRVREEESAKAPAEFFDSLPEELKYAANYTANGGKDLKSLFKKLADVEEVKSFDLTKESGQERIVRSYLEMTQYGTAEEIEDEIVSLKDSPGSLEKKAKQFQPKLETKNQLEVDRQLKEQEQTKVAKDKLSLQYQEAVYNTVAGGQLGDLKINKATQGMIYEGMMPAMDAFQTLLQATGIKSNITHLSEIYWLLKDPKSYKESLKSAGRTEEAEIVAKKLKSAASTKATSADIEIATNTTKKTLPVKKSNIFAR